MSSTNPSGSNATPDTSAHRISQSFALPPFSLYSLVFQDPAVEARYLLNRSVGNVRMARIGLGSTLAILSFFLFLSRNMIPNQQSWEALVYQGILPTILVALIGFLSSFRKFFLAWRSVVMSAIIFFTVYSLLELDRVARVVNPTFNSIYPSLMILVLFACSFSSLRFRTASLVASAIPLIFLVWGSRQGFKPTTLVNASIHILSVSILGLVSLYLRERNSRENFRSRLQIQWEQDRLDWLIGNMFPVSIASRLKAGENRISHTSEASVLFLDLVGFTKWASQRSSQEAVDRLNDLFNAIDVLTDHFGTEKVKTLGDGYMVVAGLPTPVPEASRRLVELAIEIRKAVRAAGFDCRIGVASGPVTGGVIGLKRSLYDVWGHTVNFASRLESSCPVGGIQISDEVFSSLGAASKQWSFQENPGLTLKGIGEVKAHLVETPLQAPR